MATQDTFPTQFAPRQTTGGEWLWSFMLLALAALVCLWSLYLYLEFGALAVFGQTGSEENIWPPAATAPNPFTFLPGVSFAICLMALGGFAIGIFRPQISKFLNVLLIIIVVLGLVHSGELYADLNKPLDSMQFSTRNYFFEGTMVFNLGIVFVLLAVARIGLMFFGKTSTKEFKERSNERV